MSADRSKVVAKVQALLDKAASTGFTAEAEAFRAKADELMMKYLIEDQELRMATDLSKRSAPGKRHVNICGANSPLKHQLADLITTVATHYGCEIVYRGMNKESYPLSITLYGFEADMEFVELTYTSLFAQMSRDMEPKPDPELSEWENFEMLHMSGLPWLRVFEVMGLRRQDGHRSLMAMRAARPKDHPDRNVNPKVYLRGFATGFVREVSRRLRELRQIRNETPGAALVLADRSIEVRTFYDEQTKGLRPIRTVDQRIDSSSAARGREAGSRADLGNTSVSNRRSGELS